MDYINTITIYKVDSMLTEDLFDLKQLSFSPVSHRRLIDHNIYSDMLYPARLVAIASVQNSFMQV